MGKVRKKRKHYLCISNSEKDRLSFKKKSLYASEQNREDVAILRASWHEQTPLCNVKSLVFIDESGVQNNMTRLYGRIVGGDRLHESAPGGHWSTTSIISSIRINGQTECMTIEGATDADVFRTYIDHILCPTLCPNDVVIMDNLSSHKVPGIKESIEATGAILLYLPPYSPDFNPIEKMWSKVKAHIRKIKPRTSAETESAVASALTNVSPADAEGWFASCGYVLIHS